MNLRFALRQKNMSKYAIFSFVTQLNALEGATENSRVRSLKADPGRRSALTTS